MKAFLRNWLIPGVIFGAVCLGTASLVQGCVGLSPEQQARIDKLNEDNAKVEGEIVAVIKDAQAGKIDPIALASALTSLRTQFSENTKAINAVHAEGGTWAAIWGGLGVFGRTGLHLAAKFIPAGGAWGLLSGLLGILLGGSSTTKKEAVEPLKA